MDIETVLEYTIPYQHALAVHFPLVLLLLAAGAAAGYAVRGSAAWRHAVLWLLGLGAASAYWARATGPALLGDMEGTPIVDRLIETHATAANWTVGLSALALLAALGGTLWWRRRQARYVLGAPGGALPPEPLALRVGLLVPTLLAALAVAWTGHVGAVMVWGVAG